MKPVLLTSLLCTSLLLASPVLAQEATPDPATSDQIQQQLKERIQKVKEQVDDRIRGVSAQGSQTFGIIGTLEKIVGSTLQVRTYKGTLRVIELDSNAALVSAGKPITRTDMELNATVLLMGYANGEERTGRRLVISEQSIPIPAQETKLLTVTTVTTRTITGTAPSGEEEQVSVTSRTTYLDSLGKAIKRTDLTKGEKIVAVFSAPMTASSSALRIHSLTQTEE